MDKCDSRFMLEALALAKMGWGLTNPNPMVGAVIVRDGVVIGQGFHRKAGEAHAEVNALKDAARRNEDVRGATLYVTLEPCPMCAGAIINSRIAKVFYGAKEANFGSCGSVINLFMERYGHEPQIVGGILEKECAAVMREFFEKIR